MFNQGRNSTNFRGHGRGGREGPLPHSHRGNFSGATLNQLRSDFDKEQRDNAGLRQEIEGLTQEVGRLTEQLATVKGTNDSQVAKLRSDIDSLEDQHSRDTGEYESLERLGAKLTKEKGELELALQRASQRLSSGEHDLLEGDHDRALKELNLVQERCADLQSANDAQTSRIKQAEQACQACESELDERRAEILHLKDYIKQYESENVQLGSQVEHETDQVAALRREKAAASEEIARLNEALTSAGEASRNRSLTSSVPALPQEYDRIVEEIRTQLGEAQKDEESLATSKEVDENAISVATMEFHHNKVRKAVLKNRTTVNSCIALCDHFNVDTKKLEDLWKKAEAAPSQTAGVEELAAKDKKLSMEHNGIMQCTRRVLKTAGIEEAELAAQLNGDSVKEEFRVAVETMLSRWMPKKKGGKAAAEPEADPATVPTAESKLLPTQYTSADAETQTDASRDHSHAAIQTDSVKSTTYVDVGVQNVPESGDLGVQKDPIIVDYSGNFDDYVGTGNYVDAMDPGFFGCPEEDNKVDPGAQKRPDYSDSAVQTDLNKFNDPDNVPSYTNVGVQTNSEDVGEPETVSNYTSVGIQTNLGNVKNSVIVRNYTDAGIQALRRLSPNRYILIFLCGGLLAWAISYQLDALRERAMWLDANDMSRRATIYFTDASAQGRSWGWGWIWRPSALNHIEKPYYYVESMVGFGLHGR